MEPFAPWPSLSGFGKLLPSKRFPGLFYYDSGPGKKDRPVLVLIHGLGDEADTWRHVIPPLAAGGYRVLAPDLPGFGRSRMSAAGGIHCHRDAVLELTETVCGQNGSVPAASVVFAGSSMGAAVAEAAAIQKPALVKSVILFGGSLPPGALPSPELLVLAIPLLGKRYYRSFRNNPEAAWRSLFPYYADIRALSAEDQDFLRRRVMDRVLNPVQERAYFASLRSMIFEYLFRTGFYRRSLKKLPVPVFLVWGGADRIIPRAQADYFLSIRPDAALKVIPSAGHLPQQDTPAETVQVLLDCLESRGR